MHYKDLIEDKLVFNMLYEFFLYRKKNIIINNFSLFAHKFVLGKSNFLCFLFYALIDYFSLFYMRIKIYYIEGKMRWIRVEIKSIKPIKSNFLDKLNWPNFFTKINPIKHWLIWLGTKLIEPIKLSIWFLSKTIELSSRLINFLFDFSHYNNWLMFSIQFNQFNRFLNFKIETELNKSK